VFDVAIIGAGPAGSTLARLIGKDYKVLLVDRRQLLSPSGDSTFEKCCGGLLAPDAQNMIAKLSLGVPKGVLVGPQLFTVRVIDIENSIERYYQRHYINIDREEFDRWHVSLISGSVEIRCGCLFKTLEINKDGIEFRLLEKGKEYSEQTRILVAADGASSRIRRLVFPDFPIPKTYFAIQEWFRAETNLPYFSAIFDGEITDYYSWSIPKGDCLIIGSALSTDQGRIDLKFQLLKKKLSLFGFQLGHQVKRGGGFLFRPVRTSQICTGKGNIALVGEAAGWVSPTSAEGLSYSFKSAMVLAEALLQKPKDWLQRYQDQVRYLKRNIFLKNMKIPFMYHPFLRRLVMKTGMMSMKMYGGR
jgi:flavin-dependent dehydrogenase